MFTAASFWIILVVTAAAARVVPAAAVRLRAALLAAGGLAGLVLVLGLGWQVLFLTAAVVWLAAVPVTPGNDRPVRRSMLVASPVLLVWMAGKQGIAAEWPIALLYFAGLSYFVVKAWTLTYDRHSGRIQRPDPLVCSAYFLHLPTYLSGPMHYYGEFETALRAPQRLTAAAAVDVVFRLLLGLFKVRVLGPLVAPASLTALSATADATTAELVARAFGFSLLIYFDFSGYSDMAIATSRLAGLDVPENFDRPYLSVNIRDFWRRWHITFSRVLTAYIFVPLTRRLLGRYPQAPRAVMVAGYVFTFALAGYWHGPTANFVAWGLYHAAGLIAFDLFRAWRLRRAAAAGLPAGGPTLAGRLAGVAATFTFVSIGWIPFVLPLGAP
jgi:alginate O-acetyltransferase complex protein AlgI